MSLIEARIMADTEGDKMSPCKPSSEAADVPDEDARSKAGSESDFEPFSGRDSESPLTITSSIPASDLITESVIREEVALEKEREEEEEAEKQKQKQLWARLGEETKEERYQRLQCLLMKSNMYTQYLLKRMERQKQEEIKRRERILKKQAKAEEEQKKMETNVEITTDVSTSQSSNVLTESKQKQDSAESCDSKTASNEEENPSSQNSTSSVGSTRRTRSRLSFPAPKPKSKLSATNTPISSPNTVKAETPKSLAKQNKEELAGSPSSEKENCGDTKSKKNVVEPTENEDPTAPVNENCTENQSKSTKAAQLINRSLQSESKKRKHYDSAEGTNPDPAAKKAKTEPSHGLFAGHPQIELDGTIVRPALLTGGTLRKYQVEGLNWLKVLFENGVNGLLADEMGLGKTIQCVALMCQIVTMGATGPFMVVAPLSTLPNWKNEFTRFAPHLPVVFYHGSKEKRQSLLKDIRKKHTIMKNVTIRPIVITSYEIAMVDRPYLQLFDWTYMIVDEGHRIKNKNCRLIRELKHYRNTHRLLLTGTPLQNNLSELWSLLNFLLPEIFDDLGSFETWFDVEMFSEEGADEAIIEEEKKKNVLGMLHQILTPFMLRRVKADVDLEIPPKKELLVYAPLSKVQREFYTTTLDRSIFKKFNQVEPEPEVERNAFGRPKRGGQIIKKAEPMYEPDAEIKLTLRNIMMQLRKACNHPYLIEYPLDVFGNYKVDEDIVQKCGKMMVLDKMLTELRHRGHKMEKFNADDETWVFLLSTRAGGLGVNLVAADTVIIYDSDWNPQCDLQAQDRCHRIGQTKPVVVYRFVTANTIDEKIVERASGKRKLEKMVIHKGKFKSGINREFSAEVKPLNPEELLELLKSTDHSAIVHKGKNEAISKKDLDLLLDRSDLIEEYEASKKGKEPAASSNE